MKLQVLNTKKAKTGDVTLPKQFEEPLREDLIKRAVHALQAAARQPYGADPEAGKRSSAELSRRRRKYRGSYGQGISRVPRKILSRRGNQMYMVGAFAPGTVGGRRAHPPKAEKEWTQKVNKRENRKAIRSALAATMQPAVVSARGHKLPDSYPFILDDEFEQLSRTKELKTALEQLGFADELARASQTRIRAGKGKLRGRKTRRPTSLLLVTGIEESSLEKAGANIPGITVLPVNALNAEILAPGTHPGRATLFTARAIKDLEAERLFADTGKRSQAAKPEEKSKEAKAVKKDVKKAVKAPAQKEAKPAAKAASSKQRSESPKEGEAA